jgi:4-hydroxy-tetrahydrodipicolinate synthase
MKAALMLELGDLPKVAGVKDSSGDWFENQLLLLRPRPQGFSVFQGNQIYCGASLLAGGDGLVPGHANVWPQLLVGMYQAAQRKETEAVWAAQAQLNALLALRGRAAIHTYKVIAQALGLMGDTVTTPLPRLGAEEAKQTLAAHAAIGLPLPRAARA